MPSRHLCATVLLFSAALQAEPGKITNESFTSGGDQHRYLLFVPADPPVAGPMPLLVLLHGSGRVGLSLARPWRKVAAKEGIILVAPDSLDRRGWKAPDDGPRFIVELVESIKTTQQVDPSRIYLFGHSAGAVFALIMACLESEYFAAASIHAGAFNQPSQAAAIDHAKRKTPLHFMVGTRDPFFPSDLVRFNRDQFIEKGFAVELQVIQGHDHDYYTVSSKINKRAWLFLQKNRLQAEPNSRYQVK